MKKNNVILLTKPICSYCDNGRCPQCGHFNPSHHNYCVMCGLKLR